MHEQVIELALYVFRHIVQTATILKDKELRDGEAVPASAVVVRICACGAVSLRVASQTCA